ncbi:MAG: regulatory protein GemA [Nitrospinae bacterium]|nr:regulatory protein GemA [Nitrospinota bacterium]
MPKRELLALVHIAKKELNLPDDIYRDILFVQFGKETARDLSAEEIFALLDHFRSLGWKSNSGRPLAEGSQRAAGPSAASRLRGGGNRVPTIAPERATPAQRRKIETLWMRGEGVRTKSREALRHFLNNRFHVASLGSVRPRQVTAILSALRRMSRPSADR